MIFIFIYSAYNIKNIRPDMQAKDSDNERVSLPGQEKSGQNFRITLDFPSLVRRTDVRPLRLCGELEIVQSIRWQFPEM